VGRNVAALADTPKGQPGRPSKSLTLQRAAAVITAAEILPVRELRWVGCPAPLRRISPQMLVGTGLL